MALVRFTSVPRHFHVNHGELGAKTETVDLRIFSCVKKNLILNYEPSSKDPKPWISYLVNMVIYGIKEDLHVHLKNLNILRLRISLSEQRWVWVLGKISQSHYKTPPLQNLCFKLIKH